MRCVFGILFVILITQTVFPQAMCRALPIPDQHVDPGDSVNFKSGVGGPNDKAQTFTVGIDGLLTQVDVLVNQQLDADGNLLFDIRETISGVPMEDDSLALASLNVAKEDIMIGTASFSTSNFQWLTLDMSSFGIYVEEGDLLAIALRSDGTDEFSDYRWGSFNYDPYADGIQYIRRPDDGITNWVPGRRDHYGEDHYDACFRTYVDPTPIPEPSTILLLGSACLVGIVGSRRRFNR